MPRNKYLLTGASGFLGKILKESLSQQNDVVTLGRAGGSDYKVDLGSEVPQLNESFDFVIHNAGKAHTVPKTKLDATAFYDVNLEGTKRLLQGLEALPKLPSSIVFISTIAVYGLISGENINEDRALSAVDPYGESKKQAENYLTGWCDKNRVSLTILRLPLLVGVNPPGNLGAMIRGIKKGYYFSIAGGRARKSMVMAQDIADIIPVAVNTPGIYNLTDGYHPSFHEIESVIATQYGVRQPASIPALLANLLGLAGDVIDLLAPGKSPVTTLKVGKIMATLTFDDKKARGAMGWKPRLVLDVFRIQ